MPKKFLLWFLLVVFAFITTVTLATFNPFQETIDIAVACPANTATCRNNVDAVKLYIKSVNQAGGIHGKRLVVTAYDDKSDEKVALQVGDKIGRSKAVAAIGHDGSRVTFAASKAYQQYNVPVISGSATADRLADFNWFFRTVFSNQDQAVLMAYYTKNILKYSKVGLVYTDDAYGKNLGETASQTFRELGGNVVDEWAMGTKENLKTDLQKVITGIKASIAANQAPDALLAAVAFDDAAEFIRQIRLANIKLPIIGGDTFADLDVIRELDKDVKQREQKDFFTSNLLGVTPVIFGVLDDSGQKFRADFEREYGREPGWTGASFYDAAVAVVEALKQENISGKNTAQLRSLLIERLKKFTSPETAFEGAGRLVYFDKRGNALSPAYIAQFDRQQLVSAFTQLQLVRDPSVVPDLAKKVESGEILKVGERYLQKTDIVFAGMDINQLDKIDEQTSSYLVDFYLWFRYQGDVPADDIEFTNYSVERLDSGEKLSLDKPIEAGQKDGVNYKVYRVKADFTEVFDFRLYPFDRQILKIRFRNTSLTRNQLIYVVDLVGMRGADSKRILEQAKRTNVFKSITSWIVERVQFYQNTLVNSSTLGNRQLIDTNSDIPYSQFNASIHIKRDVVSFSVKNLLPLLFFVIIAYFLMFLPFEHISIEAVSGLLLAVVFYHISLIERLPDSVGYTVLLDYAFYVVYALLGLQLLLVVLGNNERIKIYNIDTVQLMRFGRIAFPAIIGIVSVFLLVVLQRTIA
ncbi:ABC transporter substrate-binding protein [Scytonema sp. NUACC21]